MTVRIFKLLRPMATSSLANLRFAQEKKDKVE